jgi:hypothetical protein
LPRKKISRPAGVPYELSKDEIDLLYEERDQLIKKLDEDAGLAA